MPYDWDTLITVSSAEDGWTNPNSATSAKVNSVRDVIMLPYGEHKSIAVWVQETTGVYTGVVPNAVYRPSLRLKAAVIDQTRTVEQTLSTSKHTMLSEATSFDDSGTLHIAIQYGPISAVVVRDDLAGNAAFIATFDWGTQNTSGSTLTTSHQLIYCEVADGRISVSELYEDGDQISGSTYPSIVVKAGIDRVVWFKSKTGTAQQTSKVVTTDPQVPTMTIGADHDLPAEHVTMLGYMGWQGPTAGFIYNGLAASSQVQTYSLAIGSTTPVFGALTRIQRSTGSYVKILGGQRIRPTGTNSFVALGVVETFQTTTTNEGFSSYDPNAGYDTSQIYNSAGTVLPPSEEINSYDDPLDYDNPELYDSIDGNGGGGDDEQVLDPYPRVFRVTYDGTTFSVLGESASGQFYRTDAISGSDIILGTGITAQSSYQAAMIANSVVAVDSAYDALSPTATNRFFGQEIQFDPTTAPVRVAYPSALVPFAGKYTNNESQVSVALALARSGAFFAYVAPSTISTTLDRPLRVSYFEHQFTSTNSQAFPPDPPDDEDGAQWDLTQLHVKNLFGATYPARMVCLDADIDLNGLVLNRIDENGVLWMCTGIEGWWTTPDASTSDLSRGIRDGSYESDGRYAARVITVNGIFLPPHRGLVKSSREKLIKAINLTKRSGYLRTSDDGYKRESEVWLSGRPEIDTVNQKGRTEFSIGLKAPDPVKYETVSITPSINYRTGTTTLDLGTNGRTYVKTYDYDYNFDPDNPTGAINTVNYGNEIVYPVFHVAGPLASGAVVRNWTTGEEFEVIQSLAAAEVLTVNAQTMQVQLNGRENYRFFLSVESDWISLVPGSNSIQLIGTGTGAPEDAPPRLTINWRSGWIG